MNAFQLKLIAVVAMIIDHIGWSFTTLQSPTGQIMHGVGRVTFPIMAYFISEGYNKTTNIKSYIKRMLIFAVISHIPYRYYLYGYEGILGVTTSIIYTFLISLLVLFIIEEKTIKPPMKYSLAALLLALSVFGDYSIFGPLLVLAFHKGYGNINQQIRYGSLVIIAMIMLTFIQSGGDSIYMIGTLIPLVLLKSYNGDLGNTNKYSKYMFYIIYPLHLIMLGIIQTLI